MVPSGPGTDISGGNGDPFAAASLNRRTASVAVYVKVSVPVKPAFGVYENVPSALTVTVPLAGLVCRTTAVAPKSLRSTLPVTVPWPEKESGAAPKSCDGADRQPAPWATAVPAPTMTTAALAARATRVRLRVKIAEVTNQTSPFEMNVDVTSGEPSAVSEGTLAERRRLAAVLLQWN